jgi:hypothetical protein
MNTTLFVFIDNCLALGLMKNLPAGLLHGHITLIVDVHFEDSILFQMRIRQNLPKQRWNLAITKRKSFYTRSKRFDLSISVNGPKKISYLYTSDV